MAAVEIMPFRRMRQRAGGLACGQTEDAPAWRWRQMFGKNAIWMGCGDSGVENGTQQRAFVGHQVIAWRYTGSRHDMIGRPIKGPPQGYCGGRKYFQMWPCRAGKPDF